MAVGLMMIAGGSAAGLFGSLLGLGGGILIVPLLTLGFGLPLREAVGVSLVSVIVTSGAAAAVYLERHVANLRLGMSLEVFTVAGALLGGAVAFAIDERLLAGLFAVLLVYTAATMIRRREVSATDSALDATGSGATTAPRSWAARLSGPGYTIRHLERGAAGAFVAGIASALLGIGGGLVKVPVMHLVMGAPLRVATSTSNLMIGVTAAASAVVYLARGGIDPLVAGPTAVGVFAGATIGSRTAHRFDLRVLRLLFVAVLLYTAVQMIRRAIGAA